MVTTTGCGGGAGIVIACSLPPHDNLQSLLECMCGDKDIRGGRTGDRRQSARICSTLTQGTMDPSGTEDTVIIASLLVTAAQFSTLDALHVV